MRTSVVKEGVKIRQANFNLRRTPCPRCGTESKRHSLGHRWLRDVGIGGPACIEVTYSKHKCLRCQRIFNNKMSNIAPDGSNYSNRVKLTAVSAVSEGMTYTAAEKFMLEKYHVRIPATTIHDWTMEGKIAV